MDYRTRLLNALTFGPVDRYPLRQSYGLMPGVLERWRTEGLPREIAEDEVFRYLGLDAPPPAPVGLATGLGVNLGFDPPFVPRTVSEDATERLEYDSNGTLRRIKKAVTTLSYPVRAPIQDSKDWRQYQERLAFTARRIPRDVADRAAAMVAAGLPVSIGIRGFYWFPRDLMGDEGLCLAYYEQPDLVHQIIETYADLIVAVADQLINQHAVHIDTLNFAEDMCYRNGMMISPAIFREFMMPAYKRVVSLFRSGGTTVISVDTDGHLSELIPLLLECGVNVVCPAEVNAGNDIVALRRQYGRDLAFIDGLNKLALEDHPRCLVPGHIGETISARRSIDLELDYRLTAMASSGGYIGGLDHRVTPQTSFDSYRYYIKRARSILAMVLPLASSSTNLSR